ncbi:MAG: hypothetical protein IJA83_12840 [Clostridia bacterium]|nr:hypothetical protein [Clostridia bacterium]
MSRFAAYIRKDGWILAALALCVGLCLVMGGQGNAASTEEIRISRVLSAIDGAGTVEVAVHYEDSIPCSAVVVAQGAGDVAVQLRLMSAVTTLLGLDQNRVAIYEREER